MPFITIPGDFFNQDAQAGGFFPDTHTNPGFDIDKFISITGKNYIIEGIRGSGKTHILKMINEKCRETYNEKKILPVYVSLSNVSEWIEKDLAIFRVHLYANIVHQAILAVEKNKDWIELAGNSEINKFLKRVAQMFDMNEEENFDLILQKLKQSHAELLAKLTYNPNEIIEKKSESSKTSDKIILPPGVGIQLSFDSFLEQFEEKQIKYIGRMLSSENASSFIVQFFSLMKSILKHSYTLILIDECSEVKKEAQIEVFRLLKLIRGSTTDDITKNTTYFCASVYPIPVTYYPSKIKGDPFNFELGHDANVEYLQLDELSDEYHLFYQDLTRKRIARFFEKSIEASNYLDIFENERAFTLASYFANGLIRRYFDILKHSYDSLALRIGDNGIGEMKKIADKDVEAAADIIASNNILAEGKLTDGDYSIMDDITKKIGKRNKKNDTDNLQKEGDKQLPSNVYFTVSRSELRLLGHLLIQGALHNKSKTRIKKYYKEEGIRGPLIMIDLCVAFAEGAIPRNKAGEIFTKDLKTNAKSGFLWCQDFKIEKE